MWIISENHLYCVDLSLDDQIFTSFGLLSVSATPVLCSRGPPVC